MGCNSRLVGFITIETAACPASRGLVDDDASLGQVLYRLAGQNSRRTVLRGTLLPSRCQGGSRIASLQPAVLAADLTMLAGDLERRLAEARRAAALHLAG